MKPRIRVAIGALLLLLLALSLVACSSDDDDDLTTIVTVVTEGNQTLTIEPAGPTVETSPPGLTTDAPPDTTATANGTTVEMGLGTYCWTTLCVDKIGPITRDTLVIASGDEVVVMIPDGTPPLQQVSVIAFPAVESQDLDNGETAWRPDFDNGATLTPVIDGDRVHIAAALEPGEYVLTVGMFFDPGDVQYGVVLDVQ